MSGLVGLFWNLNRRDLSSHVAAIAAEHNVDLVVLVESGSDAGQLLLKLNSGGGPLYTYPEGDSRWLHVFTRFNGAYLIPCASPARSQDRRWSIRRLRMPKRQSLLLVSVHLPSKLHKNTGSQLAIARKLAVEVLRQEARERHRRTVLIGDFNMSPFEDGMVACDAIHGVLSRREARRERRTWNGDKYQMFYNPMWRHFGDGEERPAGTYYWSGSESVEHLWHLFDQVLVRPSLLPGFADEDIRILTRAGPHPLLAPSGRPDAQAASDHLPLLFTLDF